MSHCTEKLPGLLLLAALAAALAMSACNSPASNNQTYEREDVNEGLVTAPLVTPTITKTI